MYPDDVPTDGSIPDVPTMEPSKSPTKTPTDPPVDAASCKRNKDCASGDVCDNGVCAAESESYDDTRGSDRGGSSGSSGRGSSGGSSGRGGLEEQRRRRLDTQAQGDPDVWSGLLLRVFVIYTLLRLVHHSNRNAHLRSAVRATRMVLEEEAFQLKTSEIV